MLWLMCGLITLGFNACSEDNPDLGPETPPTPTPQEEVKKPYFLLGYEVTEDVLLLVDVTIMYVDLEGAKHTEIMTGTTWQKSFEGNSLPAKVGYIVEFAEKTGVSLDKEVYDLGAAPFDFVSLKQGDEETIFDLKLVAKRLDVPNHNALRYILERLTSEAGYVYEIQADGTLSKNAAIIGGK